LINEVETKSNNTLLVRYGLMLLRNLYCCW